MKILKVELQNINSLKSDSPIVIDFEGNTFKDVGLYAITGSTGSGKTTILDAITIALYQSVPRLNKSKAGLADVVSYGAIDALARVTFENKYEIYEAQWTLRLLSKTGKILSNPDEQVRLKNLTTSKIISGMKKDFSSKIIEITQLNYNQFLRSVMLAQGEFASFLSAKPIEKGALLEQITGEEIYRKIGETLNVKLSEEKRKVKEIESKVNTEDVLSVEKLKDLESELSELEVESNKIESEKIKIDLVLSWYKKSNELLKSKKELEQETMNLKTFRNESKDKIEALKKNENAEPFIENLNRIKRIEGDVVIKQEELTKLVLDIKLLVEQITVSKTENNALKEKFQKQELDNDLWQKKLQEVVGLDSEITSINNSIIDASDKIIETYKQHSTIKKNIEDLTANKTIKTKTQAELEKYLENNKKLVAVSENINSWTSSLTEIRTENDRLKSFTSSISLKELELKNTRELYSVEKRKLEGKPELITKKNKEILDLANKLSENNLQEALSKSGELTNQKSKWIEQKVISTNFINLTKELKDILAELSEFEKKSGIISADQILLGTEVEQLKSALVDAKIIFELEQKIEGFTEERDKLKDGEACGLCGSTNHPFVESYKEASVSEAKNKVILREEKLISAQELFNNNKVELATIKTELELAKKSKTKLQIELKQLEGQHKVLGLDCEISDLEFAQEIYIKITSQFNAVSELIIEIQLTQTSKDEKEKLVRTIEQEVISINLKLSTLESRGAGFNREIEDKKEGLKLLSDRIESLKNTIKLEISEFSIQLPEVLQYPDLIIGLQNNIKTYQAKRDELKNINHEISSIETEIENAEKSRKEKSVEELDYKDLLVKIKNDFNLISEKRKAILPIKISTENKRLELEGIRKEVSSLLEKSNKNSQLLELELEKKNANKGNLSQQIIDFNSEFKNLTESLNSEISKSNFNSKEELVNALLTKELKFEFSEIKKNIEKKDIAISTKETSFTRVSKELDSIKDFDKTEEETKFSFEELKLSEKALHETKGSITEKVKKDNEIRSRNKQVFDKIDAQKRVLKKWDTLHVLLGGSKDAFNTYVQRLTLESLIALANQHLYKLNKRYSLEINKLFKAGEELNFSLVDHYQTDRLRPLDTTSGGEKFLISLALALGLSDLASNNVRIDSLFIDEGFGTLDPNMLETVISTLETLQTQGKMIGVISHVENLKERISTQIQIHKNSNGVSTVQIV